MNLETNELTDTIETLKYLIEFNGKLNTSKEDVYHLYSKETVKRWNTLLKKLIKLKKELYISNALLDNQITDFEFNNEYDRFLLRKERLGTKVGTKRRTIGL